jgi:hypothetical protein
MARISSMLTAAIAFAGASLPALAFALPWTPRSNRISAPELDPSSAAAVVVLLVGLALLIHRRPARS